MAATEKDEMSSHQLEQSRAPSIEEEEPTLHWRTWAVVLACGFMLFADNYGILASGFWLNAIVAGLGDGAISIWVAEAGIVVQVAAMPLVGLWADFGPHTRRYMTVIFGLIAAVGLFVCGSANSIHVAIIGAAFFGFSIINYATCFAIVSEVVPHRSRGLGQAVLYCFTALGGSLGALAGGAMVADNVGGAGGWRWNFYLAGILHVLAAAGVLVFYRPLPDPNPPAESYLKRLSKLDFVGCFLFAAAWIPLLVGLINGGNEQNFTAARNLAPLVIGCAVFVIFILHQVFIKKDGVLNHRLFSHRNFAIAMFAIACEGWFLIPFNAFFGNMVGTLYEKRPVHQGLHGFVLWTASVPASAFCGWYSKRFRRVQELIIGGWILILAAMIGLSKCTADPADDKLAYGMVTLAGLGLGVQLTLLVATAQLAVPADLIGICSALFTGTRSAGASIGVAIASAVFTSKVGKNLPTEIAKAAATAGVPAAQIPAAVGAAAGSNATALAALNLSPAQQEALGRGALNGYAKSFPYVWYVILSAVCAIIIGMCFLRPVREMMTWKIDHPVEKEEALHHHNVHHPHEEKILGPEQA